MQVVDENFFCVESSGKYSLQVNLLRVGIFVKACELPTTKDRGLQASLELTY